MSELGIKQRRVGTVTILDPDDRVRIGFRLGGSSVPLLRAVDSLLQQGQNQILLNAGQIVRIDARGLGEMVSSCVTVAKNGGQLKLFNLTKMLRQLMTATELLTVFEVYENESQAIDSFKPAFMVAQNPNKQEGVNL